MAKLVVREIGGRWHLSVLGPLRAGDLSRLERACGEALTVRPLPLDLHLDRLTDVDDAARVFVRRLLGCGAAIVGRTARTWRERLGRDG